MNEPDWAEFIFTAGGTEYYGGVPGYLRVNSPFRSERQNWEPEVYQNWKRHERSVEIVRQLEND